MPKAADPPPLLGRTAQIAGSSARHSQGPIGLLPDWQLASRLNLRRFFADLYVRHEFDLGFGLTKDSLGGPFTLAIAKQTSIQNNMLR